MKRHKEEMDLAYEVMMDITFNLMLENRFSLVADILDFTLKNHPKDADEVNLRVMCINKAICEKRKKSPDWRLDLNKFQWGACTLNFKICIAAIDEDIDAVCDMMQAVASEAQPEEYRLNSAVFREWPAFHWVKGEQKFQDRFKAVFLEDFETIIEESSSQLDPEAPTAQSIH